MNKKLAIAASLLAMVGVGMYAHIVMCEVAIMQEHPELDQKIVIKAHRKMVRRAYAGHYNDIDLTDETADQIFMSIVAELQK